MSSVLYIIFVVFCTLAQINSASKKLKILGISSCYTGHITPSAGIFRALSARGHTVDVLMGGECCDSKVKKLFPNATSCHERIIFTLHGVEANNQFQGLFSVRETFAEKGTEVAFYKTHEFLEQNSGYDVIVTDYVLLGSHLAAELHNIPVITHYVGPLLIPLEYEPDEVLSLIYLPETKVPQFIVNFFEFISQLIWQKIASEPIYNVVREINKKFDMDPKLENSGITFAHPFAYYYQFSHIIHMGPPDIFLTNLDFMKYENNVDHTGFIPDETCFKILHPEIETFLLNSKMPLVYMSLGTVFQLEMSKVEKIFTDLVKISEKYSIIWSVTDKYYGHLASKKIKADNFMLTTNVAQLSLLMMKQVKVFITHAGANSLQEGIFSETPMLVFPGFGDQPINAFQMVKNEIAVPLVELSLSEISKKLEKVMDPGNYKLMKKKLKESKQLMTSLGGYDKAAEVVEKFQRGEIKLVDPPPLLNCENLVYRKLYMYLAILGAKITFCFLGFAYCCCGKKNSLSAKNQKCD